VYYDGCGVADGTAQSLMKSWWNGAAWSRMMLKVCPRRMHSSG